MKQFSRTGILLFVIFICISCASVNSDYPPEGRVINADFAGIVHAGSTNKSEEYEYLNYMGASWILHTFYWDRIEPEQDNWDFQFYDAMVNNAKSSNLKVLGVLGYENPWFQFEQKKEFYISPENLPDFLKFVRVTVERFKGRVDAWCIWNEPNGHFWKGTDKEFIELFHQTAQVIKETDDDVILLGGAFNRGVTALPKKLIRGLFDSGAMANVDILAFHPYELNVNRAIKLYEKFANFVNQYGYKDKIWVTEIGFPTGGWYPTKVSERELPSTIIKTYTLLAVRGARKILWYQMFDPVNRVETASGDFFGLVRSNEDYTSKGAHAFRLCATYFSDSTCYAYTSKENNLPENTNVFLFKRTDGGALVLWKDGAGLNQVSLQLPGTEHLLHDIETGDVNSIFSDVIIDVGSEPVFITWRNNSDSSDNEKNPLVREIK